MHKYCTECVLSLTHLVLSAHQGRVLSALRCSRNSEHSVLSA